MNEDIVSLERTLYNRELVASQIKIKLDEMEKLNAQQEAEVGCSYVYKIEFLDKYFPRSIQQWKM